MDFHYIIVTEKPYTQVKVVPCKGHIEPGFKKKLLYIKIELECSGQNNKNDKKKEMLTVKIIRKKN